MERKNIVFLDYDGVVNTLMFYEGQNQPRYYYPEDNKVNNYQAVRWLEKLCLEENASIVVSSDWRKWPNYVECLRNGGLSEKVEILGKTPILGYEDSTRGQEIQAYIDQNKDKFIIENFVILDDDVDMGDLLPNLVKTYAMVGFHYKEYIKAKKILHGNLNFKKN